MKIVHQKITNRFRKHHKTKSIKSQIVFKNNVNTKSMKSQIVFENDINTKSIKSQIVFENIINKTHEIINRFRKQHKNRSIKS